MDAFRLVRRTRHPVRLDASITRNSGAASAAIVSDFSLDGCCISGFFKIGEQIDISIRSIGQFRATICWSRMGKAGARFLTGRRDPPAPKNLGTCERGASAIEYAVLAAAIAVTIVVAIGGLGGQVSGKWGDVNTAVSGPGFQTGGGNSTN